jgi:hypothetical protein
VDKPSWSTAKQFVGAVARSVKQPGFDAPMSELDGKPALDKSRSMRRLAVCYGGRSSALVAVDGQSNGRVSLNASSVFGALMDLDHSTLHAS